MKKIMFIMIMLLTISTYSQEDYTKWSISGEYGMHDVSDESAVLLSNVSDPESALKDGYHVALNVRYNFNPKFGLALSSGWDNIALETNMGKPVELDYLRLNAEAYVNVFQVLDLQNNVFTLLLHGGPGVSFMRTDNNYDENVGNVSGGASGLFKINKWLALKADWTSTGNLSQIRTIDGEYEMTNEGVNSLVHNFSVGATFYLGKKDKDGNRREHADWVIPVPVVPVVNNYNYVTNPVTEVQSKVAVPCNCEYHDFYVFFDHDLATFKDTELNALFTVYAELKENPEFKLVLKAYASPTSSSDEYNKNLSDRRCETIRDKFIAMGIDPARITNESYGKDFGMPDIMVHDVARRVEMLVIRK